MGFIAISPLITLLLLQVLPVIPTDAFSARWKTYHTATFNRSSFPASFVFGTASSAYQYEGAANEDGRGPSIWDTFSHTPGKITDCNNGDVAIDSYHRYKEDVAIMKKLGFDAYRFSISWSRILPRGKLSGGVNKKGINYYNNLINELLDHGIQPLVTLFHWDLPQALEDDYGGFLSRNIVDDYVDYAEICFKEFGDRVKHWITFNEPTSYTVVGYDYGIFAPGRCSAWIGNNCSGGDSATEPYLVAHYQLLAHSAAANLYKTKFQEAQKGMIGITLVTPWYMPFSSAEHDKNAVSRALDFSYGWFMEPLTYGDYPHVMKSYVGERLPKFTKEESKMLKRSLDFLGLNYYSAGYVVYASYRGLEHNSYVTDSKVKTFSSRNKTSAQENVLITYPRGIQDLLLYTKKKYNNPLIYITENGISEEDNASFSLKEALTDQKRIHYYYHHLYYLRKAIKEGVKVKGYFAWSLMDNFEWRSGYSLRLGINFVDYKDGLKRYPKLSAHWFNNFLKKELRVKS